MSKHNTEKKYVDELIKALANPGYAERHRRIGRTLGIIGALFVFFPIIALAESKEVNTLAYAISTAFGGFLAGISSYFNAASTQWPFLSKFIDVKAVKEAAQKNEML